MDVAAWLNGLGLGQYVDTFRANDIDAELLAELSEADLERLGVTSLGHRKRLLKAIADLSEARSPESAKRVETEPTAAPEAGPAAGAERRQLTVLFCDLVGSTELSARLDPEDMGRLIRSYQQTCAAVIGRWDGHVAKYMGDGVLAYFGYPHAHEDEAERAVRAGLAVVEGIGGLTAPAGEPLAARVGIATGLVMVGDLIGEGAAKEHTVIGETPNLAARLQALAAPGAVIVAASTRRLLGGLFELDDLGRQSLKGFAEPVRAFRVVKESASESRFDALHGRHLTPLVGREHEIGLLLERWERAKEGEGQVVLLSGEPGIGKSRIVRALRERLENEPYMPLGHYCSPFHVNSALHPVIGLLERAADLAHDDQPDEKLTRLEALLARGTDQPADVVPLVASLLGVPTGKKYPPLELAPQRQRQRTLEVLVDQVEGLACREPVLAIHEDVHWADPTTLELLGLVIERVQRLPALVLITFRPEFSPPWTGHAHVTQLSLSRLTRRHGGAMIERVTGGRALPAEVLEQIVARTDGVPLFVEELTKAVLESGLLTDAGDHFELDGPLLSPAIPSSLHDSLMARLDRLASIKEVAQIGAVIGREFSHGLLAAVSALPDAQLRAALDQLVSSELIFRRGIPPEATYTFKHALVQEVAYRSLLKSRRQQLHTRVVAALEERFPQTASIEPELLAQHLTEADLAEPAVAYWWKAGNLAAERSAYIEATAHLRRGLKLLGRLCEGVKRDRNELDLLTALGSILVTTRGHTSPDVAAVYRRARELCHALGETPHLAPVLQGLRLHHLVRGELRLARGAGEELLALAERVDDDDYRLEGYRALGVVSFYLGDFVEARKFVERGIALYDAEVHRAHALRYEHDPGTTCLCYLARTLWVLGHPDQALAPIGEAVHLIRTLAHIPSWVEAMAWRADLFLLRRQIALCREEVGAALRLANEHGFPLWTAIASAS